MLLVADEVATVLKGPVGRCSAACPLQLAWPAQLISAPPSGICYA